MTVPINQANFDVHLAVDESNHHQGYVVNGSYRENNREGGLGPGNEINEFSDLMGMEDIPILGRDCSENEFFLTRESSGKLARESSLDVAQIMACADVHDFLSNDAQYQQASDTSRPLVRDQRFEIVRDIRTTVDGDGTILPYTDKDASSQEYPSGPATMPLVKGEFVETKMDMAGDGGDEEDANDVDSNQFKEGQSSNSASEEALQGSKRGAHVKGRPEMQQTARDGAQYWAAQLKKVKTLWAARALANPAFAEEYQGQLDRSFGRIRSKQECLLRTLQLAADGGLITPAEFGGGGFFGWTGFEVTTKEGGGKFRLAVEALFPAGFKEDTLKETFRRAGLVPDRWKWQLGWTGKASWVFHERRRPGPSVRSKPAKKG